MFLTSQIEPNENKHFFYRSNTEFRLDIFLSFFLSLIDELRSDWIRCTHKHEPDQITTLKVQSRLCDSLVFPLGTEARERGQLI